MILEKRRSGPPLPKVVSAESCLVSQNHVYVSRRHDSGKVDMILRKKFALDMILEFTLNPFPYPGNGVGPVRRRRRPSGRRGGRPCGSLVAPRGSPGPPKCEKQLFPVCPEMLRYP